MGLDKSLHRRLNQEPRYMLKPRVARDNHESHAAGVVVLKLQFLQYQGTLKILVRTQKHANPPPQNLQVFTKYISLQGL